MSGPAQHTGPALMLCEGQVGTVYDTYEKALAEAERGRELHPDLDIRVIPLSLVTQAPVLADALRDMLPFAAQWLGQHPEDGEARRIRDHARAVLAAINESEVSK